ncbi:hypothetical protein EMCRGX_G004002 [Ephydatia muelleri]
MKCSSLCCLLAVLITCTASHGARIVPNREHDVSIAGARDIARALYCWETAGYANVKQFAWLCVVPNGNLAVNAAFRNNYCRRAVVVNENHAEPQLLNQLDGLINTVGRNNAAYVFIYSWLIPCSDRPNVNCAQQIANASLRIRGLPFLLYYHYGYNNPHPEYTQRSIDILRNGGVDVKQDTTILYPPC